MSSVKEIHIISGYPNYGVTESGDIFSNHSGSWKKLKKSADKQGRLRVSLGRGNTKYIHRIVLETFKGECPKGMEACHNDGNNQNNSLENLRWDTSKSNMQDQYLHGTRVKGESHPMSKISDKDRLSIIHRASKGEKQDVLAKEFGLSQPTISYIVNN